jgi:hypothetical protein
MMAGMMAEKTIGQITTGCDHVISYDNMASHNVS